VKSTTDVISLWGLLPMMDSSTRWEWLEVIGTLLTLLQFLVWLSLTSIRCDSCSVVQATDYEALETLAKGVVKEKQKFERLEVSKEDLLKMFEVSRR